MTRANSFLTRVRGRLVGFVALVFSLTLVTGLATAGTASAWSWNDDHKIQKVEVWSDAMGKNIPVSILPGGWGAPSLTLLDGMRARDDFNGWDIETNAFDKFRDTGVTVVMPIGGQSSWYEDWLFPSSLAGQDQPYMWDTFLSEELPAYMNTNYGTPYQGNGIAGLSMGGSGALVQAADNGDYYSFAGSFSGYLHNSMIGMPASITIGMLDAGSYEGSAMNGSLWSTGWGANDPFNIAGKLRGKSLFISAASGIPGPDTHIQAPIDVWNTMNGMGLEWLSLYNTRMFQLKLEALGIPATYSFPPTGIHNWVNWNHELDLAKPQILAALGR